MTPSTSAPKKKFSVPSSKQDELLSAQVAYLMNVEESKISKKDKVKRFFWNAKDKSVFGRTASSWSKIGLFYLVFYGILAALVAICMWVFFQTLDPRIPKWRLERSIIGTNPGLGFRPMPIETNVESSLIWFQGSNKTNYMKWVNNLMGFLEKYYVPGKAEKGTATIKRCSFSQYPQENEVCDFDVRLWGPCSPDKYFEYHRNAPCIFLKLNRVYGWVPEYFNDTNNLPKEMPKQLVDHIRHNISQHELNTVWISCEGENPADVEYLGPITYYPKIQGFPGYYYPYKNAEGYLSPLVAVQFLRPVAGIVINIECKAWAHNIKHKRTDKIGSVHFELLID